MVGADLLARLLRGPAAVDYPDNNSLLRLTGAYRLEHKGQIQRYDAALLRHCWAYVDRRGISAALDDGARLSRPPVFKYQMADQNVLQNPTASLAQHQAVLALIPTTKRHRWFASMRSSQALAQSVFGNVAVYGLLNALGSILTESGTPFLVPGRINMELESRVSHLNEPRPTELDVLVRHSDTGYRVALECKLSEKDIGTCSRTKLPSAEPQSCNGSYTFQCNRRARCPLTALGITYWEHVPKLFRWKADQDLSLCPLKDNYQLVRNVLATSIDEHGAVRPGHVVLIYDARNPAFQSGHGHRAFEAVRVALLEPERLRKCSWQTIVGHLRTLKALSWLTDELKHKYGF